MKRLVVIALLLSACSSAVPPSQQLAAPQWDAVPAGVVESLCGKLREDALATSLAIVKTTQPLATNTSIAALGHAAQKRGDAMRAAEAIRAGTRSMPITLAAGACDWQPVDALNASQHFDQMVVELSAPLPNPYFPQEAGMFARVSLGGQVPAWYWIPLGSRGGVWAVGHIMPLVM